MFGPTVEKDRVITLDILRGVAVLGILVMNIQSFSMIAAAYFNPMAAGDQSAVGFWIWLLTHLLADLKFMALFSMLFGAGIVLMWERAERSGRSFLGIHYRRMFWLVLFGLLHAHLIWYGDILFAYGVCGCLLYGFRRLKPVPLLVLGLFALLIGSSIYLLSGLSMPYWPAEDLREFTEEMWIPPAEKAAEEIEVYRSGWLQQMRLRVSSALELETSVFLFFFLWRAGGLMLLGMGLFKLGVFSGQRSNPFYFSWVFLAAFVGIPIIAWGAWRNIQAGWPPSSFFVGSQFNYWGSLLVALGWVGLVILVARHSLLSGLTRRLEAVGRMALSCYLLQSIICTTIFYGHGFGLFGQVGRLGQILVVGGVWLFLLWLAPVWLKKFRYGLFEWVWRSLTYWRVLPLRRAASES
jgi:uncharacterized protein